MRRFYKEAAAHAQDGGFRILLDGRAIKTPAKRELRVPSERLAEAIAEEWQAQEEKILPAEMPLNRLATSVIDLMPEHRAGAIEEALDHGRTDLLCYRAATPDDLRSRQETAWQPWLDWSARILGAPLVATTAIEPVTQPEASLETLHQHLHRLDDWRLVATHAAAKLTGSLVLALAISHDQLDADTAFATALLDELYSIERWGEEEEQQRRHASLRRDLDAAGRFLRLLG